MRTVLATILFSTLFSTLMAACGDGNTVDADPFDTLQACFDEHHVTESLSVNDAIVICCLDHPLGTAMTHPSCGDTVAACVAYLGSDPVGMLATTSATAAEVQTACTDYVSKKGM
jgi:hypothetical protein